jgi:hypothetical protein
MNLQELNLDAENSFIGGWYIEDKNFCDKLIEYFESDSARDRIKSGTIVEKDIVNINHTKKNSLDLYLYPGEPIVEEYVTVHLQSVTEMYKQKFNRCNNTAPWVVEAAQIQKYPYGGGYLNWHAERTSAIMPMAARHLVFMTYLNDINEGGETEFMYQKVKVKPRKGLTLIWPADWTHTHRGLPSNTELKYIITGWYKFIQE